MAFSSPAGGFIRDDLSGMALEVKRAWANVAAAQTDATLTKEGGGALEAVPGKRIRVVAALFWCGGAATPLTFNSKGAGAGTPITPDWPNGPNGGGIPQECAHGWFQTLPGEALTVTTGAGSTTAVLVLYVEAAP
jgi:hypothetical protein